MPYCLLMQFNHLSVPLILYRALPYTLKITFHFLSKLTPRPHVCCTYSHFMALFACTLPLACPLLLIVAKLVFVALCVLPNSFFKGQPQSYILHGTWTLHALIHLKTHRKNKQHQAVSRWSAFSQSAGKPLEG